MYGVISCNLLTIFCQVKKFDGVTKWLASAGLVGTNVAGQVGTCCGVGFYIYNNNYSLISSFLFVGLRTPVHSRTCTRTHAHAHTQFRLTFVTSLAMSL